MKEWDGELQFSRRETQVRSSFSFCNALFQWGNSLGYSWLGNVSWACFRLEFHNSDFSCQMKFQLYLRQVNENLAGGGGVRGWEVGGKEEQSHRLNSVTT